jgi:hypothetical protein
MTRQLALSGSCKFDRGSAFEIPGGTEWRQWMITDTEKADYLLFIHTNVDYNWTWCASEISQFDGYKRALKKPSKVLWFSIDSTPSFPMLAENTDRDPGNRPDERRHRWQRDCPQHEP